MGSEPAFSCCKRCPPAPDGPHGMDGRGDQRAMAGALSDYPNLSAEPDDHAIGRSRGGLSTKIHALVDGKGGPLVLLVPLARAEMLQCSAT